MWDITQVKFAGVKLQNEYRPLAIRAALLLFSGILASVPPPFTLTAVLPALLLLIIGALGTAPVPSQLPPWVQPLGETVAASLVVGALGAKGAPYAPYLFIPLVTAGYLAGASAALGCAALTGLVLVLTTAATGDGDITAILNPLSWLPLMLAAALVSAWTRRVTNEERPVVEPAYADAHRLLSELHIVARQLSLGLDPQTLATALVDELREIVPEARSTVLVRSAGGRFVPLVGDPPSEAAESVVMDAWVSADLVRRGRSGTTIVALPVLMGERVVAVVVLADASATTRLTDPLIEECRTAIVKAGPRLASALLFDDVRRLATVDERKRLAREIHDGIAQDMASVGYLLDDIAGDADADTAKRLHDLREHLGRLVSEVRLSIFDLRAGIDESVGLASTLADYVQRVGQQAGLVVHHSVDEAPTRLPIATEVELMRIVQEAVTNVRRHADANNLWLRVVVDPPAAHIVVEDDGRGLGTPRPDSVGITGMKERATRIGASLSVRNRDEARGTRVEVLLDQPRFSTRRNDAITDAGSGRTMADSPSGAAASGLPTGGGPS